MKELYLCGAGNPEGVRLALRINEAQARWDRIIVLDDNPAKQGESILGVEIAGPFALLAQADNKTAEVQNLVGRSAARRWAARRKIEEYGVPFVPLISPDVDTEGVEFDEDIIVFQHAILGTGASVGEASMILMGAIVGHGARVGRCCIVGPNAVLNARVELEEGVYVGTNATLLPDTKAGAWATIGAGSVVLKGVSAEATVFGVPAQTVFESNTELHSLPSSPSTESVVPSRETAYSSSNVTLEQTISHVWRSVLNVAAVGVDDNFFDLGGHSLAASQVHQQLQDKSIKELLITDLYRFPTVRSLAGYMCTEEGETDRVTQSLQRADARKEAMARRRIRRVKGRS